MSSPSPLPPRCTELVCQSVLIVSQGRRNSIPKPTASSAMLKPAFSGEPADPEDCIPVAALEFADSRVPGYRGGSLCATGLVGDPPPTDCVAERIDIFVKDILRIGRDTRSKYGSPDLHFENQCLKFEFQHIHPAGRSRWVGIKEPLRGVRRQIRLGSPPYLCSRSRLLQWDAREWRDDWEWPRNIFGLSAAGRR